MHGPRPNTTRLRVCLVGLACGLGLAVGCSSQPAAPRGGGSSSSKADKARKDAEALAVSAVTAGAEALPEAVRHDRGDLLTGVRIAPEGNAPNAPTPPAPAGAPPSAPAVNTPAPPTAPATPVVSAAPKSAPRPGPATVIRARVASSMPFTTDTEADADALTQVCDLIEKELGKLDPPVRYRPSVGEARTEFIRKDSRTVRPLDKEKRELFAREGVTGNLVYVEYEVEVTADQVRELRSQERAGGALRIVGMLAAVALAGFLFLRADEWTKGYLTSWLALGAVALAGGAAAALIFV